MKTASFKIETNDDVNSLIVLKPEENYISVYTE
jgi:hypothetical protein